MERTGDPLGFKGIYWTEWAEGLGLSKEGRTLLLTARMYQMLPYVIHATNLVTTARPFLSTRGLDMFLAMGNRLAGEKVIRSKARGENEIKDKGEKVLRGIVAGLQAVGQRPAYLYEAEPYSGVLLYDLGLEEDIAPHINRVYDLLKDRGVEEVITVDPHTTFMLKEIYPRYIKDFDIKVKHYLEFLSQETGLFREAGGENLPQRFVIHDSCVMTRDLGIVEEARKILENLGIKLCEPESTKKDTACCGGPVEYAFSDLSHQISSLRISELAGVDNNVLVTCPICLINLSRYERQWGIRVWDMGEVLHAVSAADEVRKNIQTSKD
jgi:Fe-S oxidoreductase